jgi:hypothetical protein
MLCGGDVFNIYMHKLTHMNTHNNSQEGEDNMDHEKNP